jgi:hypothetical protein
MKIQTNGLESLLQSGQNKAGKTGKGLAGFAGLLDQEVSKASENQANAAGTVLPPLTGPLLAAQGLESVEPEAGDPVAALDGLLDKWENYAAGLGSGQSLKQAEGSLQDLEAETARIKEMAQADPGLSAVADELEVLAVTERTKFNRGDYL